MPHAASIMVVVLTGLLIPAKVQGQSHSSVSSSAAPAWIKHTWEEGSHVLPYAIDVNDENEVYVTKVLQDTAYHYLCEEGEPYCIQSAFVYVQGSFIVSYDADGSLRWERSGVAPRKETRFFNAFVGYGIAVGDDHIYTNDGNPYIDDPGSEYHVSYGGIMINAYADDGDSLWTIFLGDNPADIPSVEINGLGLDRAGNIYIAGMYEGDRYRYGDLLFSGPHALAAFPRGGFHGESGHPDIFLASYTPEGVIRWTRRIGGEGDDILEAGRFAVDDDGNTYFLCHFYLGPGGVVFGEGQPNEVIFAQGSAEHVLASFSAEGALRWVRPLRYLNFNNGTRRLTLDATGHLLIVWEDLRVVDGSHVYASAITRYSQDGALLWGRTFAEDSLHISGIATDAQGHIYARGSFSGGSLQLGDTVLHPPDHAQISGKDGFVAHYDAEGNLRWVGFATGPGAQDITAIAVGPSGDLYVTGKFEGTLYLGPEKLEQRGGGLNMFVAKYDAATIVANETTPELPGAATLTSNYPNPFTHATTIEYALPAFGQVHLSVYDVLGREVAILVDGVQHAGKHASVFDGTSLPSGTYVYRLEAGGQARTGLMLLMR